jgi:ribonuclease P protein component
MQRLRQRADFLAAAKGAKAPTSAFVLQARLRDDEGSARVGFTVSKAVGNSPERNRARRRLREMVRLHANGRMRLGHDYVVIGRRGALQAPFERMIEDFDRALNRVHAGGKRPPPTPHPASADRAP